MNNCLVTYLYDKGLKYTENFVECVKQQTTQDFRLIVFNDGVENPEHYFSEFNQQIDFVTVNGNPTEIRLQSFKYLFNSGSEHIIFLDIDDCMSNNRVEVMSGLLKTYDIISNDLSLMDDSGNVYHQSIWSTRLQDLFVFDYQFITDKNIVGIGNSALNKSVLNYALEYDNNVKVGDWFIFFQLMFKGKYKAVFTSQCQTFYRQHSENIAGIKELSEERLNYIIGVKKAHYKSLINLGYDFQKELVYLNKIEEKTMNILPAKRESSFWWEETNDLAFN